MTTTLISVLPDEVEQKWADFLAAGKTGSLTVSANEGSTVGWEIRETGRIRRA